MAAKQVWQILGKGRARQHHVTSRFLRLHLQVPLHVRQEPDNAGPLFQPRFELGNHGQRLGAGIVQIKDNQGGLFFTVLFEFIGEVFIGLDELDFNVEFARDFLNFCQKEQVVHEGENTWPGIAVGQGLRIHRRITGAKSSAPASSPSVAAVQGVTVGMVHGRGINSAVPIACIATSAAALCGAVLGWTPAVPTSIFPSGSGGPSRSKVHIALFYPSN